MKKVVIALLVSCFLANGVADAQTASESPGNAAAVGDDQVLPRSEGQVFRRYDLRPYTGRIDSNLTPQQAVIDWILRETGTATWFNEKHSRFITHRRCNAWCPNWSSVWGMALPKRWFLMSGLRELPAPVGAYEHSP